MAQANRKYQRETQKISEHVSSLLIHTVAVHSGERNELQHWPKRERSSGPHAQRGGLSARAAIRPYACLQSKWPGWGVPRSGGRNSIFSRRGLSPVPLSPARTPLALFPGLAVCRARGGRWCAIASSVVGVSSTSRGPGAPYKHARSRIQSRNPNPTGSADRLTS
jgi:hypothetical protein